MIRIFSLEIRWYGFFIVSALLISLFILKLFIKNDKNFDFEFFLDYIIIAFPLAIIAARIYYVLFNLDYYLKRPIKILAINEGGLAIHGAIILALIVLYLLCKKRDKNFWKAVDYLAPLTAFSQSIGRWGNFINQEAYGAVVKESFYNHFPDFIKKQMFIRGQYREPTFLYESIVNIFLFIILLFYTKFSKKEDGEVFSLYLIIYSIFRYFIEEQRTDSLLIADFQVAKLISILLIIVGSILFIYLRNFKHKNNNSN